MYTKKHNSTSYIFGFIHNASSCRISSKYHQLDDTLPYYKTFILVNTKPKFTVISYTQKEVQILLPYHLIIRSSQGHIYFRHFKI